ncbi:non-ribosomal peptide synthetase [Tenacibaculum halocynthiae]|uniref:non-ribosomal peptide synthetase n=1 Tax=Tenacibaculum halocynthiae TaxID=1254437 RepID=UPI003D65D6FC
MKSTIQEILIENIQSDNETGITFIDERNSLTHLSYKKIYIEACYKLHALQEKGLKPGDELIFQFESNRNFVITFWACVLGKIIPVPVAFVAAANTVKKISGIWKRLKNPFIITDKTVLKTTFQNHEKYDAVFSEMLDKFIVYDELQFSKRAIPIKAESTDIVFIQFSSGSTGEPKGVINTHEAIIYNYNDYVSNINVSSKDRFLGWVPLIHDMGLVFFHIVPLLANASQFLMPPTLFLTYPELWMESMSEHQITISGSPNFGYRMVLDNLDRITLEKLTLNKVRLMVNSAEPVSISDCRKFSKAFEKQGFPQNTVRAAYGLAEAVLGVSMNHNEEEESKEYFLNRGKLNVGDEIVISENKTEITASYANLGTFNYTEITIVDKDNNILPDKSLGFVRLRSKAITRGYYNDSASTKKSISEEGWLNTGDIGFLDNKKLVLTGRAKEMILINGQNYFPNDIDCLLEEIPGINFQQAISCNIFNENTNTDEIYVFVLYKDKIRNFIELSTQIKKHISLKIGVKVNGVIAVDKIHKTTSGKPQRYMLRDNFFKGKYDEFIEEVRQEKKLIKEELKELSKQQVENKIISVIKNVTEIDFIDINTNFFDLGITSIQTVQVKVILEELFMEQIEEVILFKYTNIRELSEYFYKDVLKNKNEIENISKNIERENSAKSRMQRLLKSSSH